MQCLLYISKSNQQPMTGRLCSNTRLGHHCQVSRNMRRSPGRVLAMAPATAPLQWKTHYSPFKSQCHHWNYRWIANRVVKLTKSRPQKNGLVEMIMLQEIKSKAWPVWSPEYESGPDFTGHCTNRCLMVLHGPVRPDWVTKKLQALIGDSCTSPYKPTG